MSGRQEPTRSPVDLWAMLGEHPSQRHNEMLAERLHLLHVMPDRRRHRIRRLMIAVWFRPSVRDRLPALPQDASGESAPGILSL